MLQNDKGHFNYDFLREKKSYYEAYTVIHTYKAKKKKSINVKSLFTNENKSQILFWLGEHIYTYGFM